MEPRILRSALFLPLLLGLFCLGCAIPGRLYEVAPRIDGRVTGADGDARVVMRLMHREVPDLHLVRETPLSPDGSFAFEPARLAVAGREFSKVYRVFLHLLEPGGRDRVIWRAEFSRRDLAGPVRLGCDPERRVALGQRCRVENPTAQPWLVEAGRARFAELCAECHGEGARASASAPDLARIAERQGRFDVDQVSEWIEGRSLSEAHGARSMPVWGEVLSRRYEHVAEGDALVGATLDPLLAYLESVQRTGAVD